MTNVATSGQMNWVGAWYAAPTRMLSATLSSRTLRQIVHLHAGGEQLRLRLSNRYGDGPVTLTSVSMGQALQSPVVRPGAQTVQFAGQPTVTLEPGQDVVSDPVSLRAEAFSDLAITFVLAQGESLTGHMFAQQTSYVSGPGVVTAIPAEATFFVYPLQTPSWWLITGIDVVPSAPLHAVVAFGSSTTDGFGSTPNANRRWPDYLAHRLRDAGETHFMSVLNAGIGGNQLTSSEVATGMPPFMFGEAGSKRLAWDALTQPGATDLIVHIGSNDLRIGVAGATLINAFQRVAQQARKTYRRVFGTTILPGGYPPEQVEQRRLVNTWLREQGQQWFDAIFDFATPLASPDDEAVLHPAYDSGDGIHPNDEGYRLMAEAVDINQLTGNPGREA
ncbi:SGNH hydrolase [Ktedonobacter sp. SOSP1-52]|uniref:GDSL-type esterase/lipase family protein n=1 Tax=Ktedonobacter sp. SOSP1-52 TaxID=2778366 RepID=UPI0019163CF4|nr:GDSL-type esterase/lipase family protein [Ktedonobacter sp. SOSP1-52]GHO62989.1 SGNH hydrolase [Ktedonobacter sp. SOSP1-52]